MLPTAGTQNHASPQGGRRVSPQSKWEYRKEIYARYHRADRPMRSTILDEFCRICHYHRKTAIRLLNGPAPGQTPPAHRARADTYDPATFAILERIWKVSGYPWSRRLKAILPLWLPWIRRQIPSLTGGTERQLLAMSPATMDRHLTAQRRRVRKSRFGRTKPGRLLKHHIPLRIDRWNVTEPGWTEIDLVSHTGGNASEDCCHSLNVTDIQTAWTETCAVMGKGQRGVRAALQTIQAALPFVLHGIDSDNGSEFINDHLYTYCQTHQPPIQFTRGRAYKKDDNAHIEQKNWTHVRKLVGYARYDTPEALTALNDLYRNEWRGFMNFFQPSVKLLRKERVGAKVKRVYDAPQTPFQRVCACSQADPAKIAVLTTLMASLDPFALAQAIERKVGRLARLSVSERQVAPRAIPAPTHPWRRGRLKRRGYTCG